MRFHFALESRSVTVGACLLASLALLGACSESEDSPNCADGDNSAACVDTDAADDTTETGDTADDTTETVDTADDTTETVDTTDVGDSTETVDTADTTDIGDSSDDGDTTVEPGPCDMPVELGDNVVANGDAELSQAGDGELVDVSCWTLEEGCFTTVTYGDNSINSDYELPVDAGEQFFSGGGACDADVGDNNLSVGVQTLQERLDPVRPYIANGTVIYSLSGDLGGYAEQNDSFTVTVVFLDIEGNELGSGSIGPVSSADRGSTSSFVTRSTSGSVPAATDSVQIRLSSEKVERFTYNDGALDNLQLVFSDPCNNPVQLGENAIGNGSAELSQAGAGEPVNVRCWTREEGCFTAVTYGDNSINSDYELPVDAGEQFFSGGAACDAEVGDNNLSVGVQTLQEQLDSISDKIADGAVTYSLTGDLGGYGDQADSFTVTAAFLDANGDELNTGTIGPVTAQERGDTSSFVNRSSSGAVPAATDSVEIRMSSSKDSGTYNDGAADNLQLVFSE